MNSKNLQLKESSSVWNGQRIAGIKVCVTSRFASAVPGSEN